MADYIHLEDGALVDFIRDYIAKYGTPPTLPEIAVPFGVPHGVPHSTGVPHGVPPGVPNGVLVTGFGVDVFSGVYVCGVTVTTVGVAGSVGGGRDGGSGVLDGSAVLVLTGVQV